MFEKFYLKVDPKESSSITLPTSVPNLPTQEVSFISFIWFQKITIFYY